MNSIIPPDPTLDPNKPATPVDHPEEPPQATGSAAQAASIEETSSALEQMAAIFFRSEFRNDWQLVLPQLVDRILPL